MNPEGLMPGRTALLLIDWQVDFAGPDGAMARMGKDTAPAQAALEQAAALLAAARQAGVTVVFARLQGSDLCAAGTPGAEFFGIAPRPGEHLVTKTRYSAFAGTGLTDMLKSAGIDRLVMAGLTTECCVASSAWAAFEADFQVVVAADACAAYDQELHRGTLKALALSGASLFSAAAIADFWKNHK